MEIRLSTELSEILSSSDIIDEITTMNNNVQKLITERIGTIKNEMASGNGLGEDQIVSDVPFFYNAGTITSQEQEATASNVRAFSAAVCRAAIEKERDELESLKTSIQGFINAVDTEIQKLKSDYHAELNKADDNQKSQIW